MPVIVSVDVGIKNLAVCQVDTDSHEIMRWQVEEIDRSGRGRNLLDAVYATLEQLDLCGFDIGLVERQPSNRTMIRVESMIAMYLRCSPCKPLVAVYSPVHKLCGVEGVEATKGKGRAKYTARKRMAVAEARRWLDAHPQPSDVLVQRFKASSKQDDYADSLLQALSYDVSKSAQAANNADAPRRVTARRPTAKQLAKRAFSLSNLKWLVQDALCRPQPSNVVDCTTDPEDAELCVLQQDRLVAAALKRHKLSALGALEMFGLRPPAVPEH
jgi:hypothetical protein